jgi:hypothetical protein
MQFTRIWAPAVFLLLARFYPHPWNFSPVLALMAFAGLRNPRSILPLAMALVLSDIFLGFDVSLLVGYGIFALIYGVARKTKAAWPLLIGGGSLAFFIVSNLSVWAFSGLYPRTFTGLQECYTMAIPFFRSAFIGDVFFGFVFFEVLGLMARFLYSRNVSRTGV